MENEPTVRSEAKRIAPWKARLRVLLFVVAVVSAYYLGKHRAYCITTEHNVRPLSPGRTLKCTTQKVTSSGFYYGLGGKTNSVTEESSCEPRKNPTIFKVELLGNTAKVTVAGGSLQSIDTQDFLVTEYSDTVILTSLGAPAAPSAQRITIDREHSSFVYATHTLGVLCNRVLIHQGICVPD